MSIFPTVVISPRGPTLKVLMRKCPETPCTGPRQRQRQPSPMAGARQAAGAEATVIPRMVREDDQTLFIYQKKEKKERRKEGKEERQENNLT